MRILLLTLLLSGVAHLAVLAGWQDAHEPAAIGQQALTVSVAAQALNTPANTSAVERSTGLPPVAAEQAAPRMPPASVQNPPAHALAEQPRRRDVAQADDAKPAQVQPVKPQAAKLQSIKPQSTRPQTTKPQSTKPQPADSAALTSPTDPPPVAIPQSERPSDRTPDNSQPHASRDRPVAESITDPAAASSEASQPLLQTHPGYRVPPRPPVYPRQAQRRGQQGEVLLRVDLSARGEVAAIRIERSSGYRLLDGAAEKAVRGWQFKPALKDGVAVASYVRIPVNFVLDTR